MANHTITAALIASVTICQLGVGENKRAQTDRPRDQKLPPRLFRQQTAPDHFGVDRSRWPGTRSACITVYKGA